MGKKIYYEKYGDLQEVLQVRESEPWDVGEGKVLVKMTCCNISPADVFTIRGMYKSTQELPTVPGYEGCGRIASVGAGVEGLKVGDRVILYPFNHNRWKDGTWQTYLERDVDKVIKIPEGGRDEDWAQFYNSLITPWVMITSLMKLKAGDSLIVTAAGSTVGQVAIQIAKLLNIRVIGTVRRKEQVEQIQALGVEDVIDTSSEDLILRVKALTNFKGADAAIDGVGGSLSNDCLRALREKGQLVIYGMFDYENKSFDLGRLLFYSAQVYGFWVPDWCFLTERGERDRLMQEVMDLIVKGKLTCPVETTYSLDEIKEAASHNDQSGRKGKIMLRP